jgi:LPXTG-motif cell wall-anchored protein
MAAPVSAQPMDKRTFFTFSAPVALPGLTLPAGQYLFRLADPNTSAKVVQVLNADGTKPYGLFFTVPAERLQPASTPEVRFMETEAGTPAAIKTWWYPGQSIGYEFIYPKEQARRLAMGASQPVLTTQAQTTTTEQTNTAELSRVGASGQETQVNASATPTASAPTGTTQEGQIAASSMSIPTPSIPASADVAARASQAPATGQGATPTTQASASSQAPTPNQTSPAPSQTTASRPARTQLPRTASSMPIVALIGTVALVSAASLGYWRTRRR